MAESESTSAHDEAALLGFLRVIASSHDAEIGRMLESAPALAVATVHVGATRRDPDSYWFEEIGHHVYAGDTGLHVAAAAYRPAAAKSLIARGADVGARNRRGAEPLHYAADGNAAGAKRDPHAQRAVIESLISAGADPNARDRSGVAPLHRAVRTRSTSAVGALLDNGADLRLGNNQGSTPLHLIPVIEDETSGGNRRSRQGAGGGSGGAARGVGPPPLLEVLQRMTLLGRNSPGRRCRGARGARR